MLCNDGGSKCKVDKKQKREKYVNLSREQKKKKTTIEHAVDSNINCKCYLESTCYHSNSCEKPSANTEKTPKRVK